MAAAPVESGSAVAQAIQSAVQPKLIENGWVVEENDTTLSEYVTMMIVNGKDMQGVQSELGGELLGVGEDDPAVGDFARWLFEEVNKIVGPTQQQQAQVSAQEQQSQPIPSTQDSQMDDASAPVGGAPTGPKSMRNSNGGRGRGGRMLGQLNRQMDRAQDLPDSLRRIKGAAGGGSGRINAHANRDAAPRGPKGSNLANGVQRMMNGGGRGGHAVNPMMQMAGNNMGQQQQMQLMQFMEMQTNMMMQMMQNGQVPNANGGFKQGGGRGGRQNGQFKGRPQQQAPPQQHAVNGRLPDGPLQAGPHTDSGMEIDGQDGNSTRKDMFDTLCRFNISCTNPTCGYAHQSPAAPAGTTVDLTDTCSFGVACANAKCSARHPSPAQKNGGGFKSDVDCKFYPNCTNPRCPFRHPSEMPPCRNGADCTVPNCKFTHSKILCRYNPCLNPNCAFKHSEGQKRGKFGDKVWTANGEEGAESGGTSERFAGFSQNEGEEELIIPGRQNDEGEQKDAQQQQQQQQMEAEVIV